MNEKKRTELLKLMKYGSDPDLALYDEVMESNEKLEVIAQKLVELNVPFNDLEPIKGDDGEKGEKGDPGKDGKDGKPGRDGKDGRDGRDGENGLDGVDGKDGKDGVDGKDGTQITSEEIISKISKKIGVKDVKDLQAVIDELYRISQSSGGGWQGGFPETQIKAGSNMTVTKDASGSWVVSSTASGGGYTKETPTGTVNGANTTFTVTATPVYIVADGSTYFENAGYVISGLEVEMTDAPTQFIRSFY